MSAHAEHLANKRMQLRAQSELQREELAEIVANIEAKLIGVDNFIGMFRKLFGRPLLWIASIGGFFFARRWRLFRVISKGAMWFSLARRLKRRSS